MAGNGELGAEETRARVKRMIQEVVEGRELGFEDAAAAMDGIMTGVVTGAQIGALVTALRMRGEAVEEIAGFASAMRGHALRVVIPDDGVPLVDTCGTGGDAAGTFNISTTAAFVMAAAGARVAKHGNRAITSRCGSADLLEGLGVAIELAPEAVARCVTEVGIGFMYAPAFHPAMRFVGPARREIGIRTVFNLLGPLTNPAGASHQLVGVGHPEIAGKLVRVLARLGSRRAVLVHAADGLDELGIAGPSAVTEYDAASGEFRTFVIAPEDVGLERGAAASLVGGDAERNVAITRAILDGERGPRRDVTLLNAGVGLYAAEAAGTIEEGVVMAAGAIDFGAAAAKVEQLVGLSCSLSGAAAPEPVGVAR